MSLQLLLSKLPGRLPWGVHIKCPVHSRSSHLSELVSAMLLDGTAWNLWSTPSWRATFGRTAASASSFFPLVSGLCSLMLAVSQVAPFLRPRGVVLWALLYPILIFLSFQMPKMLFFFFLRIYFIFYFIFNFFIFISYWGTGGIWLHE